MAQAKYYIYKNLTKGCWSVRYKGKVIAHADNILAEGVEFRVNEKGRDRVRREGKKYVHAYIVADKFTPYKEPKMLQLRAMGFQFVKYNPFHDVAAFMIHGLGLPKTAKHVNMEAGNVIAHKNFITEWE